MAYEIVAHLNDKDAQELIQEFVDNGAEKAMEQLRLFHDQGHHKIITDDELIFSEGDVVFEVGDPYLGWFNYDKLEAGLFYKLPH